MQKYYTGDNPSKYLPFKELIAISHYIMPNFGTMSWDRVKRPDVDRALSQFKHTQGAMNDDLMMYIHVPYCQSFCHYCNFNKNHYPRQDEAQLQSYVDYLIKEIDWYMAQPYVQSRNFTALYIGGGSPSTLPPSAVVRLFEHLKKVIPNHDLIEKTFTGEPRTMKRPELLQAIKDFGWQRITFGIETLNEKIHKQIGRRDTRTDVDEVFEGLAKVGFTGDRCVDIMYDLPGQTYEGFREELETLTREYDPDEIDAFGTVYLPYRPLHKLILDGRVDQPGSIWNLLRMREHLYDFLTENGYHNVIAETYSKHPHRTVYQTAHCARQDIVGVGCAARGNVKDMVSINPSDIDEWQKNIDEYGVSTQTMQSIGKNGVLDRIMVMFPRYRELTKDLLNRFSDVEHFEKVLGVLERHIEAGVVEDKGDRYVTNKLGTVWHGNLQTDYMRHVTNVKLKMLLHVISEKEEQFDRPERFKVNAATKFIAKHTDKYPRLMK